MVATALVDRPKIFNVGQTADNVEEVARQHLQGPNCRSVRACVSIPTRAMKMGTNGSVTSMMAPETQSA